MLEKEGRAPPYKAVTVCLEEFDAGRLVYRVKVGEVFEGEGTWGGSVMRNIVAVEGAEPLVLKSLPMKGEHRAHAEKWGKILGLPVYGVCQIF